MPLTQNELDTFEHKLKKRGFRRDDLFIHECPNCKEKSLLTYIIAGRTGGRDIKLCTECGKSWSWRSVSGLEGREPEPNFDLETFLR